MNTGFCISLWLKWAHSFDPTTQKLILNIFLTHLTTFRNSFFLSIFDYYSFSLHPTQVTKSLWCFLSTHFITWQASSEFCGWFTCRGVSCLGRGGLLNIPKLSAKLRGGGGSLMWMIYVTIKIAGCCLAIFKFWERCLPDHGQNISR